MSQYTEMLEFFAENGIQLTSEQLESLRESQDKEYNDKVKAWKAGEREKAKQAAAEKSEARKAAWDQKVSDFKSKMDAKKEARERAKAEKQAKWEEEHPAQASANVFKQQAKDEAELQKHLAKKEKEEAKEKSREEKEKARAAAKAERERKKAHDYKFKGNKGSMYAPATESVIDICYEQGLSAEETVDFMIESGIEIDENDVDFIFDNFD